MKSPSASREPADDRGVITLMDDDRGRVELSSLAGGRWRITVTPGASDSLSHEASWETAYPLVLIEKILEIKGPGFLCDEIRREEDPTYVGFSLESLLLQYRPEEAFVGSRLLDFGCGSGSSTTFLARTFPRMDIVGVDMVPEFLAVARMRADLYKIKNTTYLRSTDSNTLPDVGSVDLIVLSTVYEHLLPDERRTLLPLLWEILRPGGVMFIAETPYRWWPIETHTTGLPLIGYLPPPLALGYARRCSRKLDVRDNSWSELLRRGVRGGTPREILRMIQEGGGRTSSTESGGAWGPGSYRRLVPPNASKSTQTQTENRTCGAQGHQVCSRRTAGGYHARGDSEGMTDVLSLCRHSEL